jgi:hypothetical protein
MFEHRTRPLLSRRLYVLRLLRTAFLAFGLVCGSLGIGVLGYHGIEKLPWVDALLNASMILTGMGPVNEMRTTAGKFFAAGYALFSGVAFLTIVAVLLAPVVHRFLHRFHLEMTDSADKDAA